MYTTLEVFLILVLGFMGGAVFAYSCMLEAPKRREKEKKKNSKDKQHHHAKKSKQIHKEIKDTQWQLILDRLGLYTLVPDANYLDGCIGFLSLEVKTNEDKVVPIQLLKKNVEKLEKLGFKISDDGRSAYYQESFFKPKETNECELKK